MGLELGTFVDDLIQTNPLGSDDKRQGDDHLRLIKKVLQNTIKRASKAFYLPSSVSKTANYTILDTDENMTIQCNTATAFTLTLPNLDTTRAGWTVFIVKASTDMNPVFLVPSAGTINGFAKIRRSVAASITQVVWTGTVWAASRPQGAPVGSVLEYYGSNLPQGHLWANGGAIDGVNFPEVASVLGTLTPDRRGRIGVGRDDMGGVAAGRVTAAQSGISGVTLQAAGGVESLALTTTQLPAHAHPVLSQQSGGSLNIGLETANHSHAWGNFVSFAAGRFVTLSSNDTGYNLAHAHQAGSGTQVYVTSPGGSGLFLSASGSNQVNFISSTDNSSDLNHAHAVDVGGTTGVENANHSHLISGSTQNAGSGATVNNMPPSLVCNAIVVAE